MHIEKNKQKTPQNRTIIEIVVQINDFNYIKNESPTSTGGNQAAGLWTLDVFM